MKKVFFNCLVAFSLLLQVGCSDQEMETVESNDLQNNLFKRFHLIHQQCLQW